MPIKALFVDDERSLLSQDKTFEKMFKDGENAGTGLELYMVKETAESYGGNVEMKDSELSVARFDISLMKR